MFTGIIEEVGEIKSIQKGAKSARLTIKGVVVTKNSHIGDSIAVNGVCLTAQALCGSPPGHARCVQLDLTHVRPLLRHNGVSFRLPRTYEQQ